MKLYFCISFHFQRGAILKETARIGLQYYNSQVIVSMVELSTLLVTKIFTSQTAVTLQNR